MAVSQGGIGRESSRSKRRKWVKEEGELNVPGAAGSSRKVKTGS